MEIPVLLRNEATRLRILADKSKEDREYKDSLVTKLEQHIEAKKGIAAISVYMDKLEKVLRSHLAERNARGLNSLKLGIASAKNIIKTGDNVTLQVDKDGTADLVNVSDNTPVTETEGNGLNALLSLFMRERILSASQYMPVLILDEIGAKVSRERMADLSQYLEVLSEHVQIIIIEHKAEVYDTADAQVYRITNIDGVSYIDKESEDDSE